MYVVIDGIDGCGKDTQGDRLLQRWQKGAHPCLRVNEPDNSLPTGLLLRQMLRDGSYIEAHAAMFLADRMAMLATKVRPFLGDGGTVISVRSFVSTLVYQQENWPLQWLLDIHRMLPCRPTHIIILDLDPEIALQRATKRPGHMEFYEKLETQQRNRQRYLDLVPVLGGFVAEGGRVGVINALGTPDEVEARIAEWIAE